METNSAVPFRLGMCSHYISFSTLSAHTHEHVVIAQLVAPQLRKLRELPVEDTAMQLLVEKPQVLIRASAKSENHNQLCLPQRLVLQEQNKENLWR